MTAFNYNFSVDTLSKFIAEVTTLPEQSKLVMGEWVS